MSATLHARIREHNNAVIEAQWSAEEAIAWAEGLDTWPRRRFRVEDSAAGSSRLTTRGAAERLRDRVGGIVVEVIPTRKALRRMRREAKKQAKEERDDDRGAQADP